MPPPKSSAKRRGSAAPASATVPRSGGRDPLLVSVLLPLTTFSILCYEIALTRLFAFVFTYHLTALAVSFAVFGLGAGAYIRVRWLLSLPQRALASAAHLAASASVMALYLVLLLAHDPLVIVAVATAPFVFSGIAVSHYYDVRRADRAAGTYALDLLGAAVACIASIMLVAGIGADGALLALAGLAGATAVLASARAEAGLRGRWFVVAAICAALPWAAYPFRTRWPDPLLNRHSNVEKQLPRLLRDGGKIVDTAWSPVGRADLCTTPDYEDRVILTDAMNSTVFLSASTHGLHDLFAAVPYAIAPVRAALVLGSGAGMEVRIAREAGTADVEAVELNDAIIRLVRRWRAFGGAVYDQPGVRLFVEEARKFIQTRKRRYDLIQMSLVLTATAQSGTYALAEGYLFTREAFRSYLDHLEPTGALVMIDDSFDRTFKNTVTAAEVIGRTLGVSSGESMRHVAVLFNPRPSEPGYKFMLLISPTPLSAERLGRLSSEAGRRHLEFLWLPGVAAATQYRALAADAEAFVSSASVNLEPPTDDKPYLNNLAKTPADFFELLRPYLILSALMFAVLLVMFVGDSMTLGAAGRRSTALAGLYGVGFMFMELGLLHKLTLTVGSPAYVVSVILFGLLLCCGWGALLSGRFGAGVRSRLGSFALPVAIVGIVTVGMIERSYRLEGVASAVVRVACVLAMVAPIGVCLGAPFPDLLRRYGRSDAHRLASLWAVNGVGSVLGGALTLILLPVVGGRAVLIAGSALYLLAWAVDRRPDAAGFA